MNRDEIQSRITSMMAETFELEEDAITPESRLYEDLDLDSIDALDMVVKLQELLSRRVSEDELRQLRTVGDVIEMVVRANEAGPEGDGTDAESGDGGGDGGDDDGGNDDGGNDGGDDDGGGDETDAESGDGEQKAEEQAG